MKNRLSCSALTFTVCGGGEAPMAQARIDHWLGFPSPFHWPRGSSISAAECRFLGRGREAVVLVQQNVAFLDDIVNPPLGYTSQNYIKLFLYSISTENRQTSKMLKKVLKQAA